MAQRRGERVDGETFLAGRGVRELVDGFGHNHFGAQPPPRTMRGSLTVWESTAKRVVEGPFRLVEKLLCRASQHDRARLTGRHAGELQQRVFADDDFFDKVAVAQLNGLGVVESAGDFRARHQCEAFHTVKVSVFNRHDPSFCE